MITWKTTEYIITAHNPQNGLYGFDITDYDERFIGSIIIRTAAEQKAFFHELNTNRLTLKDKYVLYSGCIGPWN